MGFAFEELIQENKYKNEIWEVCEQSHREREGAFGRKIEEGISMLCFNRIEVAEMAPGIQGTVSGRMKKGMKARQKRGRGEREIR